MKNDYSFKLVAAIVFIGVIIAFASPNQVLTHPDSNGSEVSQPSHQTE